MPRFMIFDLFHTLVHGADDERDRVVAEMAGIVGIEPETLVRAYHDTWRERLIQWDAEQTVRVLAGRLGGSPSQAQVARAAALRRELAGRILASVRPATVGVLDALRDAGCRLGLVSNATAETAEAWRVTALAERFDVAVFSCDLGVAKPDRRIYLAAAEGLGAAPAECVYVGDGADGELAGAGSARYDGDPYNRAQRHRPILAWRGGRLARRPTTAAANRSRRSERCAISRSEASLLHTHLGSSALSPVGGK